MEKTPITADITQKLSRFRELKNAYEKWQKETPLLEQLTNDFSEIGEYYRLQREIKKAALYADSVVIADRELQQLFNQIRSEVVSNDGDIKSEEYFWHIANKYHPDNYAIELKKIRPLVVLDDIPLEVSSLFREAREAYCLSLPAATISLCRSLIECCIVDILRRCGRITSDDDMERSGLSERIELLVGKRKTQGYDLQARIYGIISRTSEVIHANRPAEAANAFEILRDAAILAQELYGRLYRNEFK